MSELLLEEVTDPEDPLVGLLADRQYRYRFRYRYGDEASARVAARDLVLDLLHDSRLWRLAAGGHLWLGPDGDATPVYDVVCDDPAHVPVVRDVAAELAGSRLSASVFPGEPTREAFVDTSFVLAATNLRLDLAEPLRAPDLTDRVRLEPMTPERFETFRDFLVHDYAHELELAGASREQAEREAAEVSSTWLADGVDSEGHALFTGWAEGRECGVLWVADRWPDQGYVYDVMVHEELRCRGLGAALMNHAALWCREQGRRWLGLNVFAHNTRARLLYEQLGYVVEEAHYVRGHARAA